MLFRSTKQSIRFTNGSVVTAVPTSPDAGRSEALSLLVVDECVSGDAMVDVRDVVTGEEKTVSIGSLYEELVAEQSTRETFSVLIEDD